MKQNYILTLVGALLLTTFSCQKEYLDDGQEVLSMTEETSYCPPKEDKGCTLTQGYWKNHPEDWPVVALTLGTVTYTQAQLLAILNTPVKGNGLISLAHQLIAAKLNIADGADDSDIDDAIEDADNLIGSLVIPPVGSGFISPSETSDLIGDLTDFNEGETGPGSCD